MHLFGVFLTRRFRETFGKAAIGLDGSRQGHHSNITDQLSRQHCTSSIQVRKICPLL